MCLLGFSAPVVAYAFLPQAFQTASKLSIHTPAQRRADNDLPTTWGQDFCSSTKLNMAFESEKESNMFDGPMALTKERDACGVGFVANTASGGKIFSIAQVQQ